MDIHVKNENGEVTVTLAGRLDTTTAPALDKTIAEELSGAKTLIFDLKDLAYTSSAGLRCFLKAQKTMNRQGSMKLTNVSQTIMEILEITGFTDFLAVDTQE